MIALFPRNIHWSSLFARKARVNTERVPPEHPIILLKSNKFNMAAVSAAVSIQPKIPEISIRNQMEQTISVRPERNIWDHLWRSVEPKCPFKYHLTKLLSPVPLFSILLTRKITKRAMAWVVCVQPKCTVPSGMWNFRNFKLKFCWMESAPESVPGWISCHGNPLETIEQISSCANLIKQKINKRTVIKIQVFDEQKYSGQFFCAVQIPTSSLAFKFKSFWRPSWT